MPAYLQRTNPRQKRELFQKRERELVHAVRSNFARERLIKAAENLRSARLALLKSKLYWAREAVIARRPTEPIDKIERDTDIWSNKPVDEILQEYTVA